MKKHTLAAVFGLLAFGSNLAMADGWPASVVGNWSVLGNQSPGSLRITSQAVVGQCRAIAGTIYNNPLEGFYCPNSGRIVFVRKNAATNDTMQVWAGNLSQAGATLRIGGTFGSVNAVLGGSLGEYNFSASK